MSVWLDMYKEQAGDLLVVALELLGLVAARILTLPRAVEQAIGRREGGLVQGVVAGRELAIVAGTAGESRGEGKHILAEDVGVDIISAHEAHLVVKAVQSF